MQPGDEGENVIRSLELAPADAQESGGTVYEVDPGSPKFQRIRLAAVMACMEMLSKGPVPASLKS